MAIRLLAIHPDDNSKAVRPYLILLPVEIARFTLCAKSHNCDLCEVTHKLVSVALVLTSPWMAVSHYRCFLEPGLSSP
jgi:hypothetical protein